MLVDANLLLYAVDDESPLHEAAAEWWTAALNGDQRVGLPWQSIGAFLRIVTHPRASRDPLASSDAWRHVAAWLEADPVWVPPAGARTARVLAELLEQTGVTGNLIPDAQLAALAIEHGLAVYSADSDFARFRRVAWVNPLEGA